MRFSQVDKGRLVEFRYPTNGIGPKRPLRLGYVYEVLDHKTKVFPSDQTITIHFHGNSREHEKQELKRFYASKMQGVTMVEP